MTTDQEIEDMIFDLVAMHLGEDHRKAAHHWLTTRMAAHEAIESLRDRTGGENC
jgi:hypothetical protein